MGLFVSLKFYMRVVFTTTTIRLLPPPLQLPLLYYYHHYNYYYVMITRWAYRISDTLVIPVHYKY